MMDQTARVLTHVGYASLGLFLVVYSAVIVGFSGWQSDPLVIAWARNLPGAIEETWL